MRPGPGRPRTEVFADQRIRLHTATIELVAEHGFAHVNVRAISRTSGVSTRAFYAHFPQAEDCFASTYRAIARAALRRISTPPPSAGARQEVHRERLRSLMEAIAADPSAAQVALVDSFDAGPRVQREMARAARAFERVAAAPSGDPAGPALPPALAAGIVAGVERVARIRVMESRTAELPGIVDELAAWITGIRTAPQPPELGGGPPLAESSGLRLPSPERAGDERGRILTAVLKLAARDGYSSLTVPRIRRAASVSRRTFDAQFDGVRSCFLEAVEALVGTTATHVTHCIQSGWSPKAQALLLRVFCTELSRCPGLPKLVTAELLACGKPGLMCRERMVTALATALAHTGPDGRQGSLEHEVAAAAAWRLLGQSGSRTTRLYANSYLGHIVTATPC